MNLDELMKSVMSSDPQLNDHLNKLSQTADASGNLSDGSQQNFAQRLPCKMTIVQRHPLTQQYVCDTLGYRVFVKKSFIRLELKSAVIEVVY